MSDQRDLSSPDVMDMSDRRFVRPARGLHVHDEKGIRLPEEGRAVQWGVHWARHLRDRSIEMGEATKPAKTKHKPARVSVDEES